MNPPVRTALALALAGLTGLSGCASVPAPEIARVPDAERLRREAMPSPVDAPAEAQAELPAAPAAELSPGTGALIDARAAAAPLPQRAGAGEASFEFEGAPVHTVVQTILGEVLGANYVIAPEVSGTVTLTARAVDDAQALSLLEMALAWNNARLVWTDGRYNVVPADRALAGQVAPRTGGPGLGRGFQVRAVPLRFVGAEQMKTLLEPYARERAIVQVDPARNLIVLAGTTAELDNYLRTIEIFDVDWLAGMSVGIYPLEGGDAEEIVTQLEEVFGPEGGLPVAGLFRFMPLQGQNAVLVITQQPRYLAEAERWVRRLDAGGGGGDRLYTYEVKNMRAEALATQLQQVFGGGGSRDRGASVAPGLTARRTRSIDEPAPDAASPAARAQAAVVAADAEAGGAGDGGAGVAVGDGEVSVSFVEESNALVIRAPGSQWEAIRRTIERLDVMPLQVHIEAQVLEVTLNDELRYGVSWFFENSIDPALRAAALGRSIWGDTAGSIGTQGTAGTGLSWTFLGPNVQAVVSALDSVSDVRVLSSPSVLVRSNAEAELNVGNKIPVQSTSFNPIDGGTGGGNGTFTNVQYLDTGVRLTVTPRVSPDGMVFMEIEQEVSSPGNTPDAQGNVPIATRELTTQAAVQSGETVMLAGLISQTSTDGRDGVPGLSRLPVVGGLFGTQRRIGNRQEVVILITPRVIRDPNEARRLTDEYGRRFRAMDPLPVPADGGR